MRLNIQPPWFLTKWIAVGQKPSTRRASRWDCVSDALSIVFFELEKTTKEGRSKSSEVDYFGFNIPCEGARRKLSV